jgi:predicted DsbA family dithiol-disulfide isomerase
LIDDDLNTVAIDVGINIGTFASCLTDGSQEEEVKQDVVDGSVAGATDTPTFILVTQQMIIPSRERGSWVLNLILHFNQ